MKLRVGLFCLLGGLFFAVPALSQGNFGWWWLSGLVTASALVPVVRFGPRSLWAQFGMIFLLLEVVGIVCTMSEGVVFFPEMKAQMIAGVYAETVIYLIVAAALTVVARVLKLTDREAPKVAHRPAALVAPLVLASGVCYVIYYLIFGAITFQFFTKQYYPHAAEQVAAMGNWFWGYQLARGLLMTLAVMPVIYTLRLPRWQTALIAGLLVWVIGGAGPLLVPNTVMVATQRYLHIVEILTQNASLGVTAALLLRPSVGKAGAMKTVPAA